MFSPFVVESWTLYALGCNLVFLRLGCRCRLVGLSNFKPDDYLMILVVILYSVESIMANLVGRSDGTNFGLTPEQRVALTPEEIENRTTGSKVFMVGWFTYSGVIWIMKLCMTFFFSRVTFGLDRQRMINLAFWAIGVSWVSIILTLFLTCRPWYKSWQVVPDPGPECQIENRTYYMVILVFNLITDALIINIPFPLLVHARMPLRRKIIIMLMFGGGVFVMLAAILRCVFSFANSDGSEAAAIWSCREIFIALLVGNAPMIKPIFSTNVWTCVSTSNSKENSNSPPVGLAPRRKQSRNTDQTLFESGSMGHIVEHSENNDPTLMIKTETTYAVESINVEADMDLEFGNRNFRSSSAHHQGGYTATVDCNRNGLS
ncbi:hypothetical protein RUND412_001685 [Rhizina undulata]